MAKRISPGPVGSLFLAVFSLLLGFFVWVIVRQGDTSTKPIPMSVHLLGTPDIVEITNWQPRSVPVTFTMKKVDEDLTRFADQFRINLNVAGIEGRAGLNEFKDVVFSVDKGDMVFPEQLTPAAGDDQIEIRVRAMLKQTTARVVPNLGSARPPEGFSIDLERIEVDPRMVSVAVSVRPAPGEELTIGTEPINLAGERATAVKYAKIDYDESRGIYPLPGLEEPVIEVVVPIIERIETRSFESVPVNYAAMHRAVVARLEPPRAEVTVTGPQSLVRVMNPEMLRLTPQSNRSLDREAAGESVDTAINVTIVSDDPRYQTDVNAVVKPRVVTVRFAARPPRPEAEEPVDEGTLVPPAGWVPETAVPPENETQ